MKFYMDTSNDSETEAYIRALTTSATHGTIAADARGHYTALAPYVLWPFTATLQRVTAGYESAASCLPGCFSDLACTQRPMPGTAAWAWAG